jgi:hypothetical protein
MVISRLSAGCQPQQVEPAAGLVIGAAGPGSTERLPAHHGAGGLVIDVKMWVRGGFPESYPGVSKTSRTFSARSFIEKGF